MRTGKIRSLIQAATAQENRNRLLAQHINAHVRQMSLNLSDSNAICRALQDFCLEYISLVPTIVEAADTAAREADLEPVITPFTDIVCEFFDHEPGQGASLLYQLLAQSYFAHRLIEELNEVYLGQFSIPRIPLELTESNQLIGQLLGDHFAAQLDNIAHRTVMDMLALQQDTQPPVVSEEQQSLWRDSWASGEFRFFGAAQKAQAIH